MNQYVTIAYGNDKRPLGLHCSIEKDGEAARAKALLVPPPWHLLHAAGITEVWIVTRVLSHKTWPKCHHPGCKNPASVATGSTFCHGHTPSQHTSTS